MRVSTQDDAGLTLIELLVVMVLLTVIGGIVSTTMIGAMRSTRQHQNRVFAVQDLQTQLERISRDLRVADPIRAASANSITVDLYRGSTCVRRSWTLASGVLTASSTTYSAWSACGPFPATATPVSSVNSTALRSVGNGATPLFSYSDGTGNVLATPNVNSIGNVAITLVQTVPEGRAAPTFTTSVGIKNATIR